MTEIGKEVHDDIQKEFEFDKCQIISHKYLDFCFNQDKIQSGI